jgi:antitoxin (DNA-binding transcriptional repressor) of toxin-antitoxin stability system
MLSPIGVEVDPTVKLAGVKVQAASAGRFVQLIATVPVNAPYWLTLRLKFAGCPAGTVALAEPEGAGSTKSGAVEVPESPTAWAVTPVALIVRVALLLPVTEGAKVTLTVQVPPAARLEPQFNAAAVNSEAFWPVIPATTFARGTVLEFCSVRTCCALAPTGSWLNESD